MGALDWAALCLASTTIAMSVFAEVLRHSILGCSSPHQTTPNDTARDTPHTHYPVDSQVRQIILGERAIRKHLAAHDVPPTWRRALRVLLFMRMYCFLPFVRRSSRHTARASPTPCPQHTCPDASQLILSQVLATAILMVLYGGGSAFSICMNTVRACSTRRTHANL